MRAARAETKIGVDRYGVHVDAKLGAIAGVGLWSALAFVLSLVWEISHARLYTIWRQADGLRIAWSVFHCSLGDVLIAIATFALAALTLRRVDWPGSRPWAGGAIAVTGAMSFTAWSELHNVYHTGAWSYTSDMPTIYGVGLSPLLQWLVVPLVLVLAYRAAVRIITHGRRDS